MGIIDSLFSFRMFMRKTYLTLLLICIAPFLHGAPSTEEVIEKAREFLGGSEALGKITSIHYIGDFTTAEGETGSIEIVFQKPLKQRIQVVTDGIGEITALDDFDAWRKQYDPTDESRWSLQLLDIEKVRELRANAWENLNFFTGIEKRRGSIENHGVVEVDGKKAVKLDFHHPPQIRFTRFFDIETGRLLMTQTNEGSEIREEGEVRIEGILFPETITMSRSGEVLNQIRFREIFVNKPFEASFFEVPSLVP